MPLCPLGLNDVLDAPCPFVVGELDYIINFISHDDMRIICLSFQEGCLSFTSV